MTDVTYELTARDVYDIQCLEQKLRSYQAKINAAQSATYVLSLSYPTEEKT